MPKKFSIVRIKDEDIFCSGYIQPKDLANNKIFLEALNEIPHIEMANVEILHCKYMDFPGEDSDLPKEDLNTLVEMIDYFIDELNCIFVDKSLTFKIAGQKPSNLVEEVY